MQKIQEKKPKPVAQIEDIDDIQDLNMDNEVIGKNHTTFGQRNEHVKVSDNRRPIYGVITEPLRGVLRDKRDESK